jgi:hypothetical protein
MKLDSLSKRADDLRSLGLSASLMRSGEYSASELKLGGYSLNALQEAGYNPEEILHGISIKIKGADWSADEEYPFDSSWNGAGCFR